MRRVWLGLWSAIFPIAAQAQANAPDRSLRPEPRPGGAPEVRQTLVPVGYNADIRPRPRPVVAPRPDKVILVASTAGVVLSPRPEARPKNLIRRFKRRAARAQRTASVAPRTNDPVRETKAGSVCGDRSIRGQRMSPIQGRVRGCGVAKPVKVTAVDGVVLSQPAIMDCTTANALKRWVEKGAKPAVGRLGGGIKSLKVVAHYSCRTRNSRRGARISEHGKGKAIDIAAINLKNGASITVLRGWRDRQHGKILRRMHKAACGPFGTVLGPNSDRFHQDHFHFDSASYRSGPYCR